MFAEHDLDAERAEIVRVQATDGAARADGHEARRRDHVTRRRARVPDAGVAVDGVDGDLDDAHPSRAPASLDEHRIAERQEPVAGAQRDVVEVAANADP